MSMMFFFVLSLWWLAKMFLRLISYSSSKVFIRDRSSPENRMQNGEKTSVTILKWNGCKNISLWQWNLYCVFFLFFVCHLYPETYYSKPRISEDSTISIEYRIAENLLSIRRSTGHKCLIHIKVQSFLYFKVNLKVKIF